MNLPDQPDVLAQVLAQRELVSARLKQVKHIIAVMSGKGGVGKSALTANLAAALGFQGHAVGVLDADIHGASAAAMLGAIGQRAAMGSQGVRPAIGVHEVRVMSIDLFMGDQSSPVSWKHPGGLAADTFVWRGTLEASVLREFLADTEWGDLDCLLIDMPPGADRFETLTRLVPDLDGALVITIPSQVSHRVVRRAINLARASSAKLLGLVENMAGWVGPDGVIQEELFPGSDGEAFAREMNLPYLARVPFDTRFSRTTDAGRPFVLEHADTPAGQAIVSLSRKLIEVLKL